MVPVHTGEIGKGLKEKGFPKKKNIIFPLFCCSVSTMPLLRRGSIRPAVPCPEMTFCLLPHINPRPVLLLKGLHRETPALLPARLR